MLFQRLLVRCSTCGAPVRSRLLFASAPRLQAADYYQLLGVAPSASAEEIKAAYRKAALQWHPDRQAGAEKAQAETKFKDLSQAYTTLSSPEQRRLYDQGRAHTATGASGRQEWARRSWEQQQQRQQPGTQQRPWPDGFSQSEAERVFRDAFGSNLAELLRRAQQAQTTGRRGASPVDELFGEILRQAAAAGRGGPHVEVRDEVYTRPDGRRVRRRTRVTRTADGRVATEVDEREDGSRGYASSSPATSSGIAQVIRSVAAPFVAALAARATNLFMQHAADALRVMFRLLVRRLTGR